MIIKQEQDLISVIIPIHNGEKYINKNISRLLRQTYRNIEIILILNNCKDNSQALCETLAEKDSRIKIFVDDTYGLGLVRKKGVLESKGKYILWLDIDDYFVSHDSIKNMHRSIIEDKAEIVQFGMIIERFGIFRTKINFGKSQIMTQGECFSGPLMGVAPGRGAIFSPSLCNKIFCGEILRDAAKQFNLPIFYGEDMLLSFLAFINPNVKVISIRKDAYYVYRRNAQSLTNSDNAYKQTVRDNALLKPCLLQWMNMLPINHEIILRVHSESIWSYRASINSLLYRDAPDSEILALISEVEQYDYIKMTKEYFRTHRENIWTPEMNFMISDYAPEEYLAWCKEHLPKKTKKQILIEMVKGVVRR